MKKYAVLALCLLMLLSLSATAWADGLLYDTYSVQGNELICFGSALDEEEQKNVTVDGKSVPVTYSTVGAENEPVTYICLVDNSTGMSNSQRGAQAAFLKAFCEDMGENDRLVLVYMTSKLEVEAPLTKDEAATAVAVLDSRIWCPNLYDCLIEMTTAFTSSEEFPGVKSILILSPGVDSGITDTKLDKVKNVISTSDVRFNAVALREGGVYADSYLTNKAQTLADLAESTGGVGISLNVVEGDPAAAAAKIVETAQNGTAIKLDASRLERTGDTVTVALSSGSLFGSVQVPVNELPIYSAPVETVVPAETAPAPAQTEATVPVETAVPAETVAAPKSEQQTAATEPTEALETTGNVPASSVKPAPSAVKKNDDWTFYLLIGGGVVAVLAVVTIIILMSRKKEAYDDDIDGLEFLELPDNAPSLSETKIKVDLELGNWLNESDKVANLDADEPFMLVAGANIELLTLPDEELALSFYLPANGKKSIGRSTRADIILDAADNALSGVHFEMMWDGEELKVRDRHSTNGTVVDGTTLNPELWYPVESNAVIKAGSSEYALVVKKEII